MKPLIERIRFNVEGTLDGEDMIAQADDCKVRWWIADGDRIIDKGSMPRALFNLAAVAMIQRCEEECFGDCLGNADEIHALHESFDVPVTIAIGHPNTIDEDYPVPDDPDAAKCGFDSTIVETSIEPLDEEAKP